MLSTHDSDMKTTCGSDFSVLPIDTDISLPDFSISLNNDATFASQLNQVSLQNYAAVVMLDEQLSQMRLWDGEKREAYLWQYFDVSSNLFASDGNCLVFLEGRDVLDQKPVIKINFELLVKAKCIPLILQAVVTSSSQKPRKRRLRASQAHFRRHQNTRSSCSLFLSAPEALKVNDVVRYHITTRNFFAWVVGEPLVGPDPVSALLALKVRMDIWCATSVDKLGALNKYATAHGYGDVGSLHTLVTHHLQGIKHIGEDYKFTTSNSTPCSAQSSNSAQLSCLSGGQVSSAIRKRLNCLSSGVKALQRSRPLSRSKNLPSVPAFPAETERSENNHAMSGALKDLTTDKTHSQNLTAVVRAKRSDAYQRLVVRHMTESIHDGLSADSSKSANRDVVHGRAPLPGERDLWIRNSSRDYFHSLIQHATSSKSLPAVIPKADAHRPNSFSIPPRGRQSYQSACPPMTLRAPSPILEEVQSQIVNESERPSLPNQAKYVCAKHRRIQADKVLIERLPTEGGKYQDLHELTAVMERPSTGVARPSTGFTRPSTGVARPATAIAEVTSIKDFDMPSAQVSLSRSQMHHPEEGASDSIMRFPSLHKKKSKSLGKENEGSSTLPPLPSLQNNVAYQQSLMVAPPSPLTIKAVEVEGEASDSSRHQKAAAGPIKQPDSLQQPQIPSRSSSGCGSSTYGTNYTETGEPRSATSFTSSSSFTEMPLQSSTDKSKSNACKLSPIPSSSSIPVSKSYRIPMDDFEPGIGDVKVMDILLDGMGGIRRTRRCETLSAYRKYDLYDFSIQNKSVYLGPSPIVTRQPSIRRSEDFNGRSLSLTSIFRPKTASRTSLRDAVNLQASFQTIDTYLQTQSTAVHSPEEVSRPTTPVCELAA